MLLLSPELGAFAPHTIVVRSVISICKSAATWHGDHTLLRVSARTPIIGQKSHFSWPTVQTNLAAASVVFVAVTSAAVIVCMATVQRSLYAIVTVPASASAERLADDLALFKVTGGSRSRGRKTRTQRQKPYRQTITTIVTVTILSSASTKSRRYRATGCWRSTGH